MLGWPDDEQPQLGSQSGGRSNPQQFHSVIDPLLVSHHPAHDGTLDHPLMLQPPAVASQPSQPQAHHGLHHYEGSSVSWSSCGFFKLKSVPAGRQRSPATP